MLASTSGVPGGIGARLCLCFLRGRMPPICAAQNLIATSGCAPRSTHVYPQLAVDGLARRRVVPIQTKVDVRPSISATTAASQSNASGFVMRQMVSPRRFTVRSSICLGGARNMRPNFARPARHFARHAEKESQTAGCRRLLGSDTLRLRPSMNTNQPRNNGIPVIEAQKSHRMPPAPNSGRHPFSACGPQATKKMPARLARGVTAGAASGTVNSLTQVIPQPRHPMVATNKCLARSNKSPHREQCY